MPLNKAKKLLNSPKFETTLKKERIRSPALSTNLSRKVTPMDVHAVDQDANTQRGLLVDHDVENFSE